MAAQYEPQGAWYLTLDPGSEQDVFAEDIEMYRPGGFHPVHLGDCLGPAGRYRVFDKLGHGGWGTVWLCQDKNEGRWRAVKIHAATVSDPSKCRELETAKELLGRVSLGTAEGLQQLLEQHHIALPIHHFMIHGPNGTHLAIVYPLLGSNLVEVFRHNAPHPELLKDICFQLVQAMHFLHSNGVCHGDFRPDNIMFRLADGVDQWSEEKLVEALGKPTKEPLVMHRMHSSDMRPAEPCPLRPEYVVSDNCFDYTSGVLSTAVGVSDFGVSFHANSPPKKSAIPGHFASPEDIVTGVASPGFASDVWTLMNTMLEVRLTAGALVGQDVEEVLELCEHNMGPMPKNYRAVWKKNGQIFRHGHGDDLSVPVVAWDEDLCNGFVLGQRLRFCLGLESCTVLDEALWKAIASQDYKATGLMPRLPYRSPNWVLSRNVQSGLVDAAEFDQLYDLGMLVYKWQPEERALTGEILNHPWFGDRNKISATEEVNKKNEVQRTSKSKEVEEVDKNGEIPQDQNANQTGKADRDEATISLSPMSRDLP